MNRLDLDIVLGISGLENYIKSVDEILLDSIKNSSPVIKKSATRMIQAGGKRLRPTLLIASALSSGGEVDSNTLKASAAVELVHLATLVHDDIMDNSDIRWGMPTVNITDGDNQAIVVGDYLLSLASYLASQISAETVSIINKAIMDVCDGQSMELASLYSFNRSLDSYIDTIRLKTGALLSASCRVGGLLANLDAKKLDALSRYGELFGISFQMIDDLLDLIGNPDLIKKPVWNDIKEGNYSYAVIRALNKDPKIQMMFNKDQALQNKQQIVKILHDSGAIEETHAEIKKYNNGAKKALDGISSKTASGLANLPDYYLEWAIEYLKN